LIDFEFDFDVTDKDAITYTQDMVNQYTQTPWTPDDELRKKVDEWTWEEYKKERGYLEMSDIHNNEE